MPRSFIRKHSKKSRTCCPNSSQWSPRASASLAAKRLRQEGADGEIAWDAAMWIFFAGLLGSRTFYVIQYRDHFFGPNPLTGTPRTALETLVALINLPDGGLVLYGGLIF